MDNNRDIRLKRLHGQLGDVVYEMTKVQFGSHFAGRGGWQPPINVYRCRNCIQICVDLAGVDKELIDLQIEPGRLLIRGKRPPPEPEGAEHVPIQIFAMEIDYGPFEREIRLPAEVDRDRVNAEHQNGLLWIYLPLRASA